MSERAPTSTPRVGSSRTTTRGSSCRQRAMTTLRPVPAARPPAGRPPPEPRGAGGDALRRVAAGRAARRRADARAADAVAGDRVVGARPLPPPVGAADHAPVPERRGGQPAGGGDERLGAGDPH